MTSTEQAKAKILVIDDSPVMRKAAVKMLGQEFVLAVAENGSAGWEAIVADRNLQVVFTDLNMPGLDGYQLLERIRTCEDEGIRNLPVIVVTGTENDEEARERALAMGATDFITKPFNSTEIRARAQTHSDYRRHTRVLSEQQPDPVSGALVKDALLKQLDRELSFCRRHQLPLGLVTVEIAGYRDLFLKIGRRGADSILAHVAKFLRRLVRKEDCLGRIGLARFLLILPNSDAAGSARLAERIDQQFASLRVTLGGKAVAVAAATRALAPAPLECAADQLLTMVQSGDTALPNAAERRDDRPPAPAQPSLDQLLTQLREEQHEFPEQALAQLATGLGELLALLAPEQRRDLLARLQG